MIRDDNCQPFLTFFYWVQRLCNTEVDFLKGHIPRPSNQFGVVLYSGRQISGWVMGSSGSSDCSIILLEVEEDDENVDEKLFILFMAFMALNQRCHRRRAKYFRIKAVSNDFKVSKYVVVSHLCSKHCLALKRLVGSRTRSLEMQSMADGDTLLNWSCSKPPLANDPLKWRFHVKIYIWW